MTARFRLTAVLVLLLSAVSAAAGPDRRTAAADGQAGPRPVQGRQRPLRPQRVEARVDERARRQEIADGQHPVAMVLSCADSRVPPEHIFNVGLGDLFVIRTAGAVIDRSILATAEYGATELHVPLLVVMGHESCGAVKAAAEAKGPSESANLDYLLRAIQAARRQTPTAKIARTRRTSRRWCSPTSKK